MSYFRYLCLFAYSGVQHILHCAYVLVFFVLCTLCCKFLCIVLCFCFVFLRLVYPMMPVSLDCQYLIAPSLAFIYNKSFLDHREKST